GSPCPGRRGAQAGRDQGRHRGGRGRARNAGCPGSSGPPAQSPQEALTSPFPLAGRKAGTQHIQGAEFPRFFSSFRREKDRLQNFVVRSFLLKLDLSKWFHYNSLRPAVKTQQVRQR